MVQEAHTRGKEEIHVEHHQVLFKRKPFPLIPPPDEVSENTEVWIMRGTGEVFTDYEKYLKRYDYLMQKKFVDAVNGKSGLTYFDALDSENRSTTAIENVFPVALKEPILRKVQFSTISRIDDLVTAVYDEFKRDFFPGEEVIVVSPEGGIHGSGIIREKAKFPMIRGPNGEIQRPAFSRYFVRLNEAPDEEALLDDDHVRRDRKIFTKQNLRAFLKHSLQREQWIGAPWLVKEHLAVRFKLPMEIPAWLLEDAHLLAKVSTDSASFAPAVAYQSPYPNIPQQQQLAAAKPPRKRAKNFSQDELHHAEHQQHLIQMQMQQQRAGAMPHRMPPGQHPQHMAQRVNHQPAVLLPQKGEDLDILPRKPGVRPELQFWTPEMAEYVKEGRRIPMKGLTIGSIGLLLEVWNTLNVQCEVYVLDSFTFDDFVDAMKFNNLETPCELLDEVHCAVLKLLVDEKGKVTMNKGALPDMVIEDEEEDESSEEAQDESELSTPVPDVPARSTRSRLSQLDPLPSPVGPAEKVHRATEMLADRDWVTRLAARDFEDGGWQVIMVGLLHQLSSSARYKERCDRVLKYLAPMDEKPTQETAREQYASMGIDLRISALQMMTILSVATPAIKEFLEHCSEDMTDVRKRKIEHQRMKRIAFDELQIKDRERKILLPDNMLPDSPDDSAATISVNGDAEGNVTTPLADSSDVEDAPPTNGRSLRRGNDRKRKREEEQARAAEAKKTAEEAKQQPKQSKEFRKLLVEIDELKKQIREHEAKIAECDGDLREANVQRTKVLGKDRFCNRYYWFERNGQPFGGLPTSSTASYGYANGRIWVQGPDEMERKGFIDLSPEEQRTYRLNFGVTTVERRRQEEGATYLQSAEEWGFYDSPAQLAGLIDWLNTNGDREKKLHKELEEWRYVIAQYMDAHKKFKDEEAARKLEADEEHATHVSTRRKAQEDQTAARERCLKWTNGMAMEQLGHLHSRPEKPKPKPHKITVRSAKGNVVVQKGVAVPVNRHGKPVTRQGL